MHPDRVDTLRRDHALILWLLQDSTIPGHVGDHLTDALVELAPLIDLPPVPSPPDDGDRDPVNVLGGLRMRLQAAILDAETPAEMLALGRAGRDLALAERDLLGRACPVLLATRDEAGARAAIRR